MDKKQQNHGLPTPTRSVRSLATNGRARAHQPEPNHEQSQLVLRRVRFGIVEQHVQQQQQQLIPDNLIEQPTTKWLILF